MKNIILTITLLALLLPVSPLAAAPQAKKYQVTGIVLAVDDAKITVKTVRGDETWEINRSAEMKVNGGDAKDIKVGAKVTIFYAMQAAKVELKAAASED
ncbi:MAG: hypothetical protein FWF96_07775 [Kiritimatiellaeota bacterium]|nr:hypothetical protein [Kiritimatiellota bacterium]